MKRFSVSVGKRRREFVGGIDAFLAEDIAEFLRTNEVQFVWDETQQAILELGKKETLEIRDDASVSRLV